MTRQTRATLKGYFNTGDVPTEQNFTDFIDSYPAHTVTYSVAASNAPTEWLSTADYLCDGTADEVQIQAAIDALGSTGGAVVLSPGTFNLVSSQNTDFGGGFVTDACIVIDENDGPVELRGHAGTILQLTADQDGDATMLLIGGVATKRSSKTVVRGIEFDGNVANQSGTWVDFGNVAIVRADYVLIESCYIHGNKTPGSGIFSAWGSQYITITNNIIEDSVNSNSCIRPHNSYHIVTNNIIIGKVGATSGTLVSLVVDEVGFGQASNITFANNVFYGGINGLLLQGCNSSTVCNNLFSTATAATAYAITLSEYDDGDQLRFHSQNNNVYGNVIYNYSNGIRLSGGATYGALNNIIAFNNVLDGPDTNMSFGIRETGTATSGNQFLYNYLDPVASTELAHVSSASLIVGNVGWVTENYGAAATVADGGTIAHGCAETPVVALLTGSVAGEIVTVTSIDATNITVAIKDNDGTAGTTQTIYWGAWV